MMDQIMPMTTTSGSSHLILDLQSFGLRLADQSIGLRARKGGAGPTDHKAITVAGRTVMVPVFTGAARHSPFEATGPGPDGSAILLRDRRAGHNYYLPAPAPVLRAADL